MELNIVKALSSAVTPIKAMIEWVANMESYDIIQINYEKSDKSDTKTN